MRKRFNTSFQQLPAPHSPHQASSAAHPDTQSAPSSQGSADDRIPEGQRRAAQDTLQPSGLRFQLRLRPTDAAWETGQELAAEGHLHDSYPKPGSWGLHVVPSGSMGERQCHVMMKLVGAADSSARGQAMKHPLRSALRHLENRGGLLAQVQPSYPQPGSDACRSLPSNAFAHSLRACLLLFIHLCPS